MDASADVADFAGDASLHALVGALQPHGGKPLALRYANRMIGSGYHVTEIKAASFTTLDCGGEPDAWNETVLQIEDLPHAEESNHMSVRKFLGMLDKVAARIAVSPDARLTFEIGRGGEPMQVFDIGSVQARGDLVTLLLVARAAICKPRHRATHGEVACCAPAASEKRACC